MWNVEGGWNVVMYGQGVPCQHKSLEVALPIISPLSSINDNP